MITNLIIKQVYFNLIKINQQSNQKVYITVYQYIGKTLANDPNIGIFEQTGSFYSTTNNLKVTGSFDFSLDGTYR